MERTLNIKGFKLNLNFEPQLTPQGHEVRLSGISKNLKLPDKWVNKELKNHWIFTFRYIGTDNFISFEFDYNDNFFNVIKQ